MNPGFTNHGFEPLDVRFEYAAAEGGEPVITAAGIFVGRGFGGILDQPLIHEVLEIVVKGSRARLVPALRLTGGFEHDAVPVPILGSEGQQDVKRGLPERKERIERGVASHSNFVISKSD